MGHWRSTRRRPVCRAVHLLRWFVCRRRLTGTRTRAQRNAPGRRPLSISGRYCPAGDSPGPARWTRLKIVGPGRWCQAYLEISLAVNLHPGRWPGPGVVPSLDGGFRLQQQPQTIRGTGEPGPISGSIKGRYAASSGRACPCYLRLAEQLFRAGLSRFTDSTRLARPAAFGPAMEHKEWKLFRVRPSNHPRRWTLAASILLDRFLEPGLERGLGKVMEQLSPAKLIHALCAFSKTGPACAGRGQAFDLAVNAVLPFMHSWDEYEF